jgi:large subunit ribosomal protein L23
MKKNPYEIIQCPLLNEKATMDSELRNAYHFKVLSNVNKIEIKNAIEEIYKTKGIKVLKVRVITKKPKRRRFRFRYGLTSAWKKAIVFIDKSQKLELF